MLVTDLFYKLLAFTVLSPLFSVLLSCLLALGGTSVLSDIDIALFFAGPFGWISAVALGSVWLAIFALEQASLLAILAARTKGLRLSSFDSLLFAARHLIVILRVAGRLIAISLIALAPFLIGATFAYSRLLNDYDINYYLDEKPFEFKLAAAVGGVLAIASMGLLVRLYSSWFLVLPLVLFDRVFPKNAIELSKQSVTGHRYRILLWTVAWFGMGIVANAIATAIVGGIGQLVIPSAVGSVAILAVRIGLMLLLLTIISVALNVIATIGFALVLFYGYQELNPNACESIASTRFSGSSEQDAWRILTRWRMGALCLVAGLVAALIGFTAINSLQLEDRVQVMAHRGASKTAPENSLAAIRQAIMDHADWVEIDVQETADGEVVVIHDSDLMKLAGNKLKIWEANVADLSTIDIGSRLDPKYADERVPTLAQVLEICHGKIGVIIELKYYGHDQQLEQRVVNIVERYEMSKQVMVMSLEPERIKKLKSLRPAWKCGVLMSVSVGNMKKIEADFFAVNAKFATRSFVQRSHKIGKEIYVWTVDDAASMSMMMNRGVDGVITNVPAVAREVLRNRSEMNNSERLLTEIAALLGAKPVLGEP